MVKHGGFSTFYTIISFSLHDLKYNCQQTYYSVCSVVKSHYCRHKLTESVDLSVIVAVYYWTQAAIRVHH